MSVHGEFERYLRDTLSALRASERADHLAWADEVEAATASGEVGLEERARRVLESPLGREDACGEPAPLADAVAGLVSISRIILGR